MWLEEPANGHPGDEPAAVTVLIPKTLSSDAGELNPRLLKAIKSAARSSAAETRAAVSVLLSEMRKPHSQVRYLAVILTGELFTRSKLFRTLLVDRLDEFLALGVGFRPTLPLPPPTAVAAALRSKTIELLEKWNDAFGLHYRRLRLGFSYLKHTLHFRFPNRLETQSRLRQERREREARTQQLLLDKFDRFKDNYASVLDEVRSTVDEIEECLDILSPGENDFNYGEDDDDDDAEEEFKSLSLQRIREEALKEGRKVRENTDNSAVFDVLRESHKLLVSKRVPAVKDWISMLVRVDLPGDRPRDDSRFRDTALKEFIDLRNLVQSVEERCGRLGCSFDEKVHQEEEEDDLWEEGTIEISAPGGGPSASSKSLIEESVVDPTTNKGKGTPSVGKLIKKPSDGVDLGSTSERSKLLAEAPLMNWGSFLDNWGSSQDVLANQRGLELENHWGRVDYDATIPAKKIAELNLHRMVYKEEPVQTQPCLAPLKKGGLCQRRDLKVCPFHGPIVPRDSEGKPIEQNPSEGETEKESSTQPNESSIEKNDPMIGSIDMENHPDSVNEMADILAKRAVKNIRERDREMKSLKRAKLAKIREHNDAVLRESALASTSYSEHVTASREHERGVQVKRTKQASRLRKKETTKDRIAQKLLKTNVTEASIRQVMQGEHSRYREAFPNQW